MCVCVHVCFWNYKMYVFEAISFNVSNEYKLLFKEYISFNTICNVEHIPYMYLCF